MSVTESDAIKKKSIRHAWLFDSVVRVSGFRAAKWSFDAAMCRISDHVSVCLVSGGEAATRSACFGHATEVEWACGPAVPGNAVLCVSDSCLVDDRHF